MKRINLLTISICCYLLLSATLQASTIYVSSQQEFDNAHDNAAMNDSIIWENGSYADIYMDISKDDLFISAASLGNTVFTGDSRVEITGDHITLRGFQYLNGDVGTRDVLSIRGSHILITQINIRAYRSYKYLRVRESSQYVDITYCNFENRLNLDDQNILSILVHETNPGYHKIQYCSFKNFDGSGNDLGIEPIRIGLSTQANRISRTLVEYCYFTQCNGDGEIISSKASQNVYRFNTFEDNPLAELVLRHGSEAIVYGNFFLQGKGGVRVREGQNHYIYNNYFYDLRDRPIFLQNESSDPLADINIAFNTILNSAEVRLGGDGSNPPTNVVFANNIFAMPMESIFEDATGMETWIGNMSEGSLGISRPSNGLTNLNPELERNSEGFFGLSSFSPAIDAAIVGYKELPSFEGIADIDSDISSDLMGQARPASIDQKDLGCNEFPHDILIQPMVTEENTGPHYNTSMLTSLESTSVVVEDLIQIHPNPVSDELHISINSPKRMDLTISIFNMEGKFVDTLVTRKNFFGEGTLSKNMAHLPVGLYTIRASGKIQEEQVEHIQSLKLIKVE